MQAFVKIQRLMPVRTGVSERTGNQWARQQGVFRVYKQNSDGTLTETSESFTADITDTAIMNSPQWKEGQMAHVRLFMDAREYQGRTYQQITLNGFTPQGENAVQQPQQAFIPPQPAQQAAPQAAQPFTPPQAAAPQAAQPQPVNYAQPGEPKMPF